MAPSLLDLPPRLSASALGRPRTATWVRRTAWLLAVVAVASLFAVGGSQPEDPSLFARRPVAGFGEGTLKVLTVASGSTLSPTCLLYTSPSPRDS